MAQDCWNPGSLDPRTMLLASMISCLSESTLETVKCSMGVKAAMLVVILAWPHGSRALGLMYDNRQCKSDESQKKGAEAMNMAHSRSSEARTCCHRGIHSQQGRKVNQAENAR